MANEKVTPKIEEMVKIHSLSAEVKAQIKETYSKESEAGELRILELPMNDMETEILEVAVRIPRRAVVNQYMKYIDINPKKAQEVLINQCVLSNREQVHADDALFLTCIGELAELIPIRKGKVKNF